MAVDPTYLQLLDKRISKLEEDAELARSHGNTGLAASKPTNTLQSTRHPQHDSIIMERFLNERDDAEPL